MEDIDLLEDFVEEVGLLSRKLERMLQKLEHERDDLYKRKTLEEPAFQKACEKVIKE